MFPYIDTTTTSAGIGAGAQARRPDLENVAEIEQVQTLQNKNNYEETPEAKAADVAQKSRKSTSGSATQVIGVRLGQDSAELGFHLTREEREVFVNAISGKESPEEMSEEERQLLQKTSERIDQLIEAAMSRTTENRERIDSAVKEWYARLSKGKLEAGEDLLTLIRKAARGELKPV